MSEIVVSHFSHLIFLFSALLSACRCFSTGDVVFKYVECRSRFALAERDILSLSALLHLLRGLKIFLWGAAGRLG